MKESSDLLVNLWGCNSALAWSIKMPDIHDLSMDYNLDTIHFALQLCAVAVTKDKDQKQVTMDEYQPRTLGR